MPRRPVANVAALLLFAASAAATGAQADDAIRHPLPSDFPILSAVEIPSGKPLVVLSGAGAPVSDPAALSAAWRPTAAPGRKQSAR